jgi:hypothetical protein
MLCQRRIPYILSGKDCRIVLKAQLESHITYQLTVVRLPVKQPEHYQVVVWLLALACLEYNPACVELVHRAEQVTFFICVVD